MKAGDFIKLIKRRVEVVKCQECSSLMVNLDADEVARGDLVTLKRAGVRISNPETEERYCLHCDIEKRPSFRKRLSDWFQDEKDEDDSSFHVPSPAKTTSPSSIFGGSSSGGGFGGFGGGIFSGGGASRGF